MALESEITEISRVSSDISVGASSNSKFLVSDREKYVF